MSALRIPLTRAYFSWSEQAIGPSSAPVVTIMPTNEPTLAEIQSDFELLDDWEDRYRYVIELGKALPPLPDADRIEQNKVRGCASQVWLVSAIEGTGRDGRLTLSGDSDAHIVKGLVAVLLAMYRGKSLAEAAAIDAPAQFARLGLKDHLTPQRSNGLASMVERIRSDVRQALGAQAG